VYIHYLSEAEFKWKEYQEKAMHNKYYFLFFKILGFTQHHNKKLFLGIVCPVSFLSIQLQRWNSDTGILKSVKKIVL
jgi:hypothetical protein